MSISLDPLRLRFLLERLHSEFPTVDYNTLVRAVMHVECTTDPSETLEAYSERVRQTILEDNTDLPHGLRTGRIFRQRTRSEELVAH